MQIKIKNKITFVSRSPLHLVQVRYKIDDKGVSKKKISQGIQLSNMNRLSDIHNDNRKY